MRPVRVLPPDGDKESRSTRRIAVDSLRHIGQPAGRSGKVGDTTGMRGSGVLAASILLASTLAAASAGAQNARWLRQPIIDRQPELITTLGIDGAVSLDCLYGPDTRLRECKVEKEIPRGLGLAGVALAAAERSRADPGGGDAPFRVKFNVRFSSDEIVSTPPWSGRTPSARDQTRARLSASLIERLPPNFYLPRIPADLDTSDRERLERIREQVHTEFFSEAKELFVLVSARNPEHAEFFGEHAEPQRSWLIDWIIAGHGEAVALDRRMSERSRLIFCEEVACS